MALRNILQEEDPILRGKCYEVTIFNDHLGVLLDDLKETMFAADGVGLAAPQVGIPKRLCVVCVDGETMYELVNPVIVKTAGTQKGIEGCLSIPGKHGIVERPKTVWVEAKDRFGKPCKYKVSDLTAVAFCHEIDHLDGTLFIDKIISESK
ncbi:MAG: peptide deformylase [Clostridiales bacterium]|nr:peptide deformylase [Clostridiales bacterium]